MLLPTYEDIEDAARVINGHAVRTPLLNSRYLDEVTGAKIYIKPECLQRTGSFKFRGAFNAVSRLTQDVAAKGIVACSSGNHAQGVADAATTLGYKSTIVMPHDAPELKKQRTKRLGASVVEYNRATEDREQVTETLAEKMGATIVHPYENFHVIAGQGTVGREIAIDIEMLGIVPDRLLVCTGGGGLTAGVMMAVQHHFPSISVHPVEPEGYDDYRRSYEAKERLGDNTTRPSVCDAVLTPKPGERSFAICSGKLGQGLVVSDDEALTAVGFAFRELKLVAEPGGAVALAALLSEKLEVKGQTIVVVISGGNIDPAIMARAVNL